MAKYTVVKTFQHGKIKAMPGQTLDTGNDNPAISEDEAKLLVAKGLLAEGKTEKKQDK